MSWSAVSCADEYEVQCSYRHDFPDGVGSTSGWIADTQGEFIDLTVDNRRSRARAHSLARELVDSNGIEVHVCGTHAEWEGKTPEDFPDYVNVSAAGPAQINDYVALGYEVIILP